MATTTTNADLIAVAERHLNPHLIGDRPVGDVAATLVTSSGNQFHDWPAPLTAWLPPE